MCCPQRPWVLCISSSNRPTTVPKGCIIKRRPTRPEEFARPFGNFGEFESSRMRGVPMPLGAEGRELIKGAADEGDGNRETIVVGTNEGAFEAGIKAVVGIDDSI